jgi:selenocysteine lyase/cysteine desulfurase
MLSVGVEAIERRVLGLAGQVVEGVLAKGFRVAGSMRPGERSAIVSFTRDGLDVGELSRRLTAQRIHHHVLHQRIRLSPHLYNNSGDVDAALAAL